MFAAILSAASLIAGSTVTYASYASYLALSAMVVGVYDARRQRQQAQKALDRSVTDRNVMVREAVADRPHIFGRVRTSGQVQFPGSSGTYNDKLHFALSLGDELDAIEDVWFGDQAIGTLDADGWTTEPPFARLRVEPIAETLTIGGNARVTLAHLAYAIDSVAIDVSDVSPGTLTANQVNNPPSGMATYYVTADDPTQIVFHADRVGQTAIVHYRYTKSTTFARAKAFLGASGQVADPYLVAQLPGNWSATDKFAGTAYISGTWVYDPDIYPSGVLDVSAVVRGEKCYDPRTATTVWTRNPALIAWKIISKRFPSETYDSTSLIAAANACDALVDVSGTETQARYTYDDVISSTTNTKAALERALQAMVGSAVRVAGTWYIWAGVWVAATIALDENDLAPGEIIVQGMAEDGVLFNGVGGRFTDPARWVEDAIPIYVSPAYVTEDGGDEEVLDSDLTMITDTHRAQRVNRLLLHKARQALTFACTLDIGAYPIYPGQMVTWTIERYGWSGKTFRCLNRVYSPATGTLQALFQEDAEAIYDHDYAELVNVDPAPNTNLPDPLTVAAPVMSFASGAIYATVSADGSQRPYLRAYWAALDESVERVEIWWRRTTDTVWQQAIVPASEQMHDLYGVASTEVWVVWARAINGIGVRSAWTVSTVTIDTDAPTNFLGDGMVETRMIAASAATDVYTYDYAGAPLTVDISGSTADDTAITDNYLVENDGDESVTVVVTGQVMLTVTGTTAKAYLAIEFFRNCTASLLDNPTYDSLYNWEGYAISPVQASGTSAHTLTVTRSIVLAPDDPLDANEIHAVGVRLSALGDTGCTAVTASNPMLRIEVVKR